jgi:hypothetical protein
VCQHGLVLLALKEADANVVLSKHREVGLWCSFPASIAVLNMRFKTVSSRLISPADTGLRSSGTLQVPLRCLIRRAGRAGYMSAMRFAMYARMSLAVIDDNRLFPIDTFV